MHCAELNQKQRGDIYMKCEFCKKQFEPENMPPENLCPDCAPSEEELTNGKGDDEDEQFTTSVIH